MKTSNKIIEGEEVLVPIFEIAAFPSISLSSIFDRSRKEIVEEAIVKEMLTAWENCDTDEQCEIDL